MVVSKLIQVLLGLVGAFFVLKFNDICFDF